MKLLFSRSIEERKEFHESCKIFGSTKNQNIAMYFNRLEMLPPWSVFRNFLA